MKNRENICLSLSLIAFIPNLLLAYSLLPKTFFVNNNNIIMLIGLAGFITAATTLYFAIPFYDDNTNSRQPYTKRLLAGIGIGSINLIAVIILTPSVFISWGARGFSQITMFLNNI